MAILTRDFFISISIVLLSLLAAVVLFMRRCFTYWKRRGVYTSPPRIPFGNAAGLVFQKTFLGFDFKDLYDTLKRRGLRYGGYYFFTKPIFVPIELDLIKRIMVQDFKHFTDRVMYANEELEPLTAHLVALKGSKWRQLRSKLTPTFTLGKIKGMFETLLNCTNDLVGVVDEMIQENKAIEINELMGRFSTDVIGSCAFGLECNSLRNPNSEFRVYGKKYFDTSLKDSIIRLMMFLCPEVLAYTKIRTLRKDVHDFFMNMVTQTVDFREKNNIDRKDFMQILIQMKNNANITNELEECKGTTNTNDVATNGASITLNELAAHCMVIFLAAFETTSTTFTLMFYELVQNLEIQEKVRQEINRVLAKYDGKITYDGIAEMTYMDKCVNEGLRKYPPIPIHMRECSETYKVPDSDLVLEKGSFVFIPALAVQRDPDYYPDPEKFDPERFSEENKATRHPSTYTPFGDGPRACVGGKFGMLEVKVGLIALLRNFKFTLNSRTQVPPVADPRVPQMFTVKGGVWINAEKIVYE